MTLEQLRIFVAVAEALHVTRAAARLNLTQSAASAAIAALEERYATRLFHRIGRRIELTEAGAIFLGEARAVLQRAQQAEAILAEVAGLKRGSLSLFASQTIANYWLPPLLYRFRQEYPEITITLTVGNTAQAVAAVNEGAADLGFVEGEIAEPALVRQVITPDELVLVVGAGHPWAARARIAPRELTGTPWVLREQGSGTRSEFEAALARHKLAIADLTVALELPSNEAVCAAVEAGAGATVISRLVVARGLRFGSLRQIGFALPARRFCVLRHGERYPSKAQLAFAAMIRKAGEPRSGG